MVPFKSIHQTTFPIPDIMPHNIPSIDHPIHQSNQPIQVISLSITPRLITFTQPSAAFLSLANHMKQSINSKNLSNPWSCLSILPSIEGTIPPINLFPSMYPLKPSTHPFHHFHYPPNHPLIHLSYQLHSFKTVSIHSWYSLILFNQSTHPMRIIPFFNGPHLSIHFLDSQTRF